MILHVYSGNLFGGIETNLLALSTADHNRSDGATSRHGFALAHDASLADRLRSTGTEPLILGPARFRYPWTVWQARRKLSSALAKVEGVVAHGTWAYRLSRPSAHRSGKPLALWNHDQFQGLGPLDRYALAHPPDLLIANSRFTAAGLQHQFGRAPEAVIYPVSMNRAVDDPAKARASIRHEFETPSDAVVVLMHSRFEPLKGHAVLMDALIRMKDVPSWRCWLVGGVQKPDEIAVRTNLEAWANQAGIGDRVKFTGYRDDVPAILAAADLHCQPNVKPEAFGLTYVEALAAGLPSVGSDLGGAAEILTPECGRLVPPGDAQALADTLTELILDEPLRRTLGATGPSRASALRDPFGSLLQVEATFESFRRRVNPR